jgi:hypothetical protein
MQCAHLFPNFLVVVRIAARVQWPGYALALQQSAEAIALEDLTLEDAVAVLLLDLSDQPRLDQWPVFDEAGV